VEHMRRGILGIIWSREWHIRLSHMLVVPGPTGTPRPARQDPPWPPPGVAAVTWTVTESGNALGQPATGNGAREDRRTRVL
jgi:hypothetical protein